MPEQKSLIIISAGMAGHGVEPGGTVTPTAASGKNAAQLICADDGVSFTTNLP